VACVSETVYLSHTASHVAFMRPIMTSPVTSEPATVFAPGCASSLCVDAALRVSPSP
jgi:hypothetical protein